MLGIQRRYKRKWWAWICLHHLGLSLCCPVGSMPVEITCIWRRYVRPVQIRKPMCQVVDSKVLKGSSVRKSTAFPLISYHNLILNPSPLQSDTSRKRSWPFRTESVVLKIARFGLICPSLFGLVCPRHNEILLFFCVQPSHVMKLILVWGKKWLGLREI